MFKRLKEKFNNLGYNRQLRVLNYINHVQEKIELESNEDKEIVSEINVLMADRIQKIKELQILTIVLYLAIYFSIFSFFLTDLPFLAELVSWISTAISAIGTAVFLVILYFVAQWKELYYQDMNLLAAHLISIYNNQKYTDAMMFNNSNLYKHYIDFFKRRGYKRE